MLQSYHSRQTVSIQSSVALFKDSRRGKNGNILNIIKGKKFPKKKKKKILVAVKIQLNCFTSLSAGQNCLKHECEHMLF